MSAWLDALTFDADGLIPAIAQDKNTGQILMMAWQSRQALELTAQTRRAVYFSRSRGRLWHKGEQSGHIQIVHEIRTDCDGDVITLIVTQVGGIACHTGRKSCFYQVLDLADDTWVASDEVIKDPALIYGGSVPNTDAPSADATQRTTPQHISAQDTHTDPAWVLDELVKVLAQRKTADKDTSYVASLYHKGLNKILEKVGEEATETLIAAKELQLAQALGQDTAAPRMDLVYEMADLWFHGLVALSVFDITGRQVLAELARRFGLSGIDEKAARASED